MTQARLDFEREPDASVSNLEIYQNRFYSKRKSLVSVIPIRSFLFSSRRFGFQDWFRSYRHNIEIHTSIDFSLL